MISEWLFMTVKDEDGIKRLMDRVNTQGGLGRIERVIDGYVLNVPNSNYNYDY